MDNTNMANKLCLITGANSGIGKATAMQLAERGAYILMLCRDQEKTSEAKADIIRETGNRGIEIILADLSWQREIRQAAAQLKDRFNKLDVLINNAGMIPARREETADNIERTLAVNYLAPFLLTNLLFDLLEKAPEARVINVSSEVHRTGASIFDLDNLQLEKGFSPMKAYGLSKLCLIMFTHELARRKAGTSISTYALHPGVIGSNLASEAGFGTKLFFTLGKPFMSSPESGAETSVFLATSEKVKRSNGHYFKNKKEIRPADIAYDDNLTSKLWEISKELTGLYPKR